MLLVSGRLYLAVPTGSQFDAGRLAGRFCESTGLRGGGSSTAAQIGGATKEKMADYREVIRKLLRDG